VFCLDFEEIYLRRVSPNSITPGRKQANTSYRRVTFPTKSTHQEESFVFDGSEIKVNDLFA
jgi:hypothetical protein